MWEIQFSEAVERWYERVPRDVAEQFLDRLFDCVEGWMHVGPPEEADYDDVTGTWSCDVPGGATLRVVFTQRRSRAQAEVLDFTGP